MAALLEARPGALWEAPVAGRSQAVALARGPSATRVAPAEPAGGLEMGDRRRAVPECSGLPRGVCALDDRLSGVPLAAAQARCSHRIRVPPHCKVTPAGRALEWPYRREGIFLASSVASWSSTVGR